MKPFSFIHAADLHLGSPFKGVSAQLPSMADLLRSATFTAFDALIDLCLEKAVRFLLIAGDVFDTADRSLRAQLAFRDGLARLSDQGIDTFVAFGNHDPWEAWSSRITWPEKVHVFGADEVETVTVSVDGAPAAAVSGISYRRRRETRRLSDLFHPRHPDLFQVALLHSNCGGQPAHGAYAPCSVDDLMGAGFDYWALGHVHEAKVLGTDPHIVYPGCTQGLSIRETGRRGCYLVTVNEAREAALSFYPLDKVRWQTATVSISGQETLDELDRVLGTTVDQLREAGGGRPMVSRIYLTGRGPLYGPLRQPGVVEEILERLRQAGLEKDPLVWIQALGVDCMPDIDLTERSAMDDLLGQVLRTAETMRSCAAGNPSPPEAPGKPLMPALKDVYENRRLKRYLAPISQTDCDRLLRDAQLLCLDLLEPGP